jgi:hypothetical protein
VADEPDLPVERSEARVAEDEPDRCEHASFVLGMVWASFGFSRNRAQASLPPTFRRQQMQRSSPSSRNGTLPPSGSRPRELDQLSNCRAGGVVEQAVASSPDPLAALPGGAAALDVIGAADNVGAAAPRLATWNVRKRASPRRSKATTEALSLAHAAQTVRRSTAPRPSAR